MIHEQETLQRRHNGHDGVSNHQLYDCLFNRLFGRRSKKTPRHWLCKGNSSVIGKFTAQRASNAEKVSIWWRHHDMWFNAFVCSQARDWAWHAPRWIGKHTRACIIKFLVCDWYFLIWLLINLLLWWCLVQTDFTISKMLNNTWHHIVDLVN